MPTDRLDSWKEIAGYLKRDVTTVQRWEKREGMPVHRHLHDKLGSVYAYQSELDAWTNSRTVTQVQPREDRKDAAPPRSRRMWPFGLGVASGVIALIFGYGLLRARTDMFWRNPIADAQLKRVTDFGGVEQAAAISRDGLFIAFQSDRDGHMDIWLKQAGAGRFKNLTKGRFPELVNDQVRTVGFSPDGSLVTFWTKRAGSVRVWAVPVLGGEPQPYLPLPESAAEFDWSHDGSMLVYHTTGEGDPTFVREVKDGTKERPLLRAGTGLHAHFPVWSPDGGFVYFVQGEILESDLRHADIWRVRSTGGTPERITHHNSRVTHPLLLDDRTLMYLATDADGSGPWLYSLDIERRMPHRLSPSVDAYTSLAASAEGRALVLSVARPKGTLWRVPLAADHPADVSSGAPISLTTGRGFQPRLGPGSLLYVASSDSGDAIWKVGAGGGDTAASLWSEPGTRIFGGPAIDAEGTHIAFSVEQRGKTLLYVMNTDGTGARVVTPALVLVGAPAWQPGSGAITTAAMVDGAPRLFRVALDGSAVQLGQGYAIDPVWSHDGRILVYSGPDIGTSFPLKAMTADGKAYALPNLTLTRGSRRACFLEQGHRLVVMQGDMKHKDLLLVDLDTGDRRQLTQLPSDFNVDDFDITHDGREVILERVQAQSDVVLLSAR